MNDRERQALAVLRSAIDRIEYGEDGESILDRSLRLRGAAVLVLTASLEIAMLAGALEREAQT